MNRLILISAMCMQVGWISGVPYGNNDGVGAYAYQDSNGNRYGGTFGLNDDQAQLGDRGQQAFQPHFNPFQFGPDFDDFFPEYFRNFEHLLKDRRSVRGAYYEPLPPRRRRCQRLEPLEPLPPLRPLPPLQPFYPFPPLRSFRPLPRLNQAPFLNLFAPLPPLQPLRPLPPLKPLSPWLKPLPPLSGRAFNSNLEYQKKAIETARKAYDITSNQAGYSGYMPNFDFSRLPAMGSVPGMGGGFGGSSGYGSNAAFASAQAAPGYTHQMALLNPSAPNVQNVDVTHRFGETAPGGGFMGVSSSSFASSSNINGKEENHRMAETLVNNNGKITHYKVQD